MALSVPGRHADPNPQTPLAELCAYLQRAAVRGFVPQRDFREATETFKLSEIDRLRLTEELGRLNLQVGKPMRARKADSRAQEKVVLPRVNVARGLLERFADSEGRVTSRATEGVVRLTGLSVHEASELRAAVPALQSFGGSEGMSGTGREHAEAATQDVDQGTSVASGDTAEAVAAALALLAEDRFVRRPEKRILTALQEVGLSVLLRGGAERVGEEPTDEELAGLPPADVRRRARDCLIVHNQGLVHSLARQYPEQGLDYEDLFQHGMLGVLRAARKFDPRMGNKFSTYATWWIRQTITRAIADEGSLIRIPVHMHELVQRVARTERELLAQNRSLRAAEVAVACDLSVKKVEEIRRISRRTDSLDRVIGDGTHLGELLELRTALPGVEHAVLDALSQERVMDVVRLLPERYAHIVIRRFGLDGRDPATLEEIGKDLNVTRERIRQLEARVMPLLQIAYNAGEPYTALSHMLTDPWLGPTSVNPLGAIAKDLARNEWKAGVGALREYRRRNRNAFPGPGQEEGAFPLGNWVDEQRRIGGIRGRGLPTHRRIVLESLGMVWEREPEVGAQPFRSRRRPQPPMRTPQMRPHSQTPRHPAVTANGPVSGPAPSHREAEHTASATCLPVTEPTTVEPTSDAFQVAAVCPTPGSASAGTTEARREDTQEELLRPSPYVRDHTTSASMPVIEAEQRSCDHDQNPEGRRQPDYPARWEAAIRLAVPFDRNVQWMAEYALVALRSEMLPALMGGREATAVADAAEGRQLPDRPVALALGSLIRVLDALRDAGRRPEDFFESTSPALLGDSPRAYFTKYPLVKPGARLALSDALRMFLGNTERSRALGG